LLSSDTVFAPKDAVGVVDFGADHAGRHCGPTPVADAMDASEPSRPVLPATQRRT
jgi:hypothetical protein